MIELHFIYYWEKQKQKKISVTLKSGGVFLRTIIYFFSFSSLDLFFRCFSSPVFSCPIFSCPFFSRSINLLLYLRIERSCLHQNFILFNADALFAHLQVDVPSDPLRVETGAAARIRTTCVTATLTAPMEVTNGSVTKVQTTFKAIRIFLKMTTQGVNNGARVNRAACVRL